MDNQLTPDNNGNLVVKNRAWRRKRKNLAQLEGKSKKFYTTKRKNKRKKKKGKKK